MGFMNKLNKMKSFLFDEEEEKEERKPSKKVSKKDVKKEEPEKIKNNDIEELYFEDVSEPDVPVETEITSRVQKKETEFNFPEFDDDDFMVVSKKPEPIIPIKKEEPKRVLYQGSKRKEENKKFKPSPIISPIYGLLDNDGNTVKEKESSDKKQSYNEEVSFDEVRKKAYGGLDEEIENTMKRLSKKTIEEAEQEMEEELSRAKKKNTKVIEEEQENIITKDIDDDYDDDDDMILPNVNFKEIDVDIKTSKSKKKDSITNKKVEISEDDEDDDDTKEQDLFNLIDTMYQNKEDED